jgi:hypothetical protein
MQVRFERRGDQKRNMKRHEQEERRKVSMIVMGPRVVGCCCLEGGRRKARKKLSGRLSSSTIGDKNGGEKVRTDVEGCSIAEYLPCQREEQRGESASRCCDAASRSKGETTTHSSMQPLFRHDSIVHDLVRLDRDDDAAVCAPLRLLLAPVGMGRVIVEDGDVRALSFLLVVDVVMDG